MPKTTFINCMQRSGDWFAARLGRATGSRAEDLTAVYKSGANKGMPTKAALDYRDDLITERLTGRCDDEDDFISHAMQRGIDAEAVAFERYESAMGLVAHRSGFLQCTDIMAGASLDGHVQRRDGGIEGIIEVKCLKSRNHMAILRGDVIPAEFLPQLTHNLWVSGAAWADFCAFDDRFPQKHLQLFVRRLYAADVDLIAYEDKVLLFLHQVGEHHKELLKRIGVKA